MHDADKLEAVLRYHECTKHQFHRYARSAGTLDWVNQPNPFRRYEGAPLTQLPILGADEEPVSPRYQEIYRRGAVPSAPLMVRSLSRLFEYALALSAWKQAGGTRWALRSNPSSGNLHPTEGYLLIGACPGLAPAPGLYHYAPREHGLERRANASAEWFAQLMREFPPEAFLVGLSSIHWREAWKYGERAFRYCQHDAGHAVGTLRIAAGTLGWSAVVLHGLADESIEALLGLNRAEDFAGAEREQPELVMLVWPNEAAGRWCAGAQRTLPLGLDPLLARELTKQDWCGTANRLSRDDPIDWAVIDEVTLASRQPTGERDGLDLFDAPAPAHRSAAFPNGPSAGRIIRQRRSLLACDGRTSITAERFYAMLARVMPRVELEVNRRPLPWDAMAWEPRIHLALFVHRVDGLDPGLYVLVRDPAKLDKLKRAMHRHFDWSRPPGCPADLPLHRLESGDARQLATQVSCSQDIAGDGVFSLGMIAEYRDALFTHGPWFYRPLFWETGVIGQVLYLEAEAAGIGATGIGCFFDDPVHQVFGFSDLEFQSLYHFTVGGPVRDSRLTTLAPYGAHAQDKKD
ncbi:SagB-type dehydrogenase domain-containing protein [Variovorax sp. CF079]|uniref:SagB/ThcOx family dehydrogenase n=1 Tax=Variovorax sp. CF079 TaxID=1882774 RepID=UPI0008887A03|nr:SagB/ThcOx family dehydrogenase [Variovorax sp. CF079]SDE15608.1 SagB-type dehydrogenase domain-containing protein [Variovorax sp. CF079]